MNPAPNTLATLIKKPPVIVGAAVVFLAVVLTLMLSSSGPQTSATAYYEVKRGNFLISIVEGGSVEAVNEINIRNEVEGTARIIHIVPEGTYVKKGDLLVELDSGNAQDQVNQQEIAVRKAELALINAEEQLSIGASQTNSDITAALIKKQLAEIDLEKYVKGELEQSERELVLNRDTIAAQLLVDGEAYTNSMLLYEKGFETKAKMDSDRLNFMRTQKNLEQSTNALWMFLEFDSKKMLTEYESKVEEAEKELLRVVKKAESSMNQYEAERLTQERTLALNKDKLARDLKNLDGCKIYAPSDGLVVYPVSENSRYGSDAMIEEGATIRYRQALIKLPDVSAMKLTIKVHESQVGKIRSGMPAYVVMDPLPDQRFQGYVSKVGLLPSTQSRWSNPNLKVYDTEIRISEKLPTSMKPGVSAHAEIIITNLTDVLTVPVQAVTTLAGKPVVYLKGNPPVPTPVEVGLFNTKFIEITKGLNPGDQVLLSPPLDSKAVDLEGGILNEGEAPPTNAPVIPRPDPAISASPESTDPTGAPGGAPGRGAGFDREAMMKQYDKDGDGELNEEERATAMAAMRARFGGGQGGGRNRSGSGMTNGESFNRERTTERPREN